MMGKKAISLAPLAIAKLKTAGLHFVGHAAGLALHVSSTGARSWILRMMIGGKRCDVGLGAYPENSLAVAKEAVNKIRQQVKDGIDPIAARRTARASLKAEHASFITFEDAAKQYIAAHEKGWKSVKHAEAWPGTLKKYAYPVIGSLHVRDISLAHILKIIEPIWNEKTVTAGRLRGRIEKVLDWAKARGFRTGDNPAQWRGNLNTLLPGRHKIAKVQHHAALDWQECPAFIADLRKNKGNSSRALEFCILTACRSGEVRGAKWSEIDMKAAVWTIPAERMKAGKEHRVPLSHAALTILKSLPRLKDSDFVFPNGKGVILGGVTLMTVLRSMNKACKAHGFRSTFRDWAGETTAFPREVIEHAMAHQLKDKAEAAYARGDLFTKRAALMKAWADYLVKPRVMVKDITPIKAKAQKA